MAFFDDYITEVLMRDLVGHDRKPAAFLVYLWLSAEHTRRGGAVKVSYADLAERTGLSKSSAQSAIAWLARRKLLSIASEYTTATPSYTIQKPWKRLTSKPER